MSDQALTCSETVRAMWDYVDNALPGPMRDAVTAHLAGCDNCAGHVAFARRLVEGIATTPVPETEVEALKLRVQDALRTVATS
jgi:anti-sigma factor RsiW